MDRIPLYRLSSPEMAAVPEAFKEPKEEIVAPVMVPVALRLAEVRSPEKKPPPCTPKFLEKATEVVPILQTPEVAVMLAILDRS